MVDRDDRRLMRDLSPFSDHQHHSYESIDEFLAADVRSGVQSIGYGPGVLDIMFVDRGAATTVVFFHAAVPASIDTFPVFNGLRVAARLDANVISVSDPSLALGLRLAWHSGNRLQRLQRDLPRVLAHLARETRLMFFGASGGGFASMFYASHVPGSLAFSANPQTDVARYYQRKVDEYAAAAWEAADVRDADVVTDLVGRPFGGATIAYLQNEHDPFHIDRHMTPWIDALRPDDDAWTVIGDWGPGHAPPPGGEIGAMMSAAIRSDGRWHEALSALGFELVRH